EVLHRDVVGALGLAAVEDRDDVRMVESGGALRLAAEALDELVVRGVAVVEELQRHAPAELLVFGQVDVRPSAPAELALDDVAPVEDAIDQGVRGGHGRDRASTSTLQAASPPSAAVRSGPRQTPRSRSAGARERPLRPPAGYRRGRRR